MLTEIKRIATAENRINADMTVITGKVDTMRDKIKEMFHGRRVKESRGAKLKTLHIKDIESSVNKTEIEEILCNTSKIEKKDNLEVKSIRPDRSGNQTATVQMPEKEAMVLIKLGKLRIGLSRCRVQERINVEHCCKCWGYHNKADTCENDNRSEKCRNCAGTGHREKDSIKPAFCPLCKCEGTRLEVAVAKPAEKP